MNVCEIVEASAGTGKTQALAERLVELMRLGVKPQEIVALTFSRAAALEIYERFVTLLADKAESDHSCVAFLREVLATQHLSQIGTLDSFLMRVARSFPLELGLEGELSIMDKYREASEAAKTSFSMLRRTDRESKKVFAAAFAAAMDGECVRSFVEKYRRFVEDWHGLVLSHPSPGAWGDWRTIWGEEDAPPVPLAREEDLDAAAEEMLRFDLGDKWREAAQWVRGFRGSFSEAKGFVKKFLECGNLLGEGALEFTFFRKPYSFAGGEAKAVRRAFSCVFGYMLRRSLEHAKGVFALVSEYEKAYAARVRSKGLLVFSDVPRLVDSLGESERLAIEYRLDSRIRAWALDEFQDTSREQWRAIAPLIDEAVQSGGEKSVFIVGDRKQAIYGWRNGDVGIFEREMASGRYSAGCLAKTYRSGPAVVEAVNRVFASGRIPKEFPSWKSPVHETAREDLGGFVQTFAAPGKEVEDFAECAFNALCAVDPVAKGLSAAILVRENKEGEAVAAYLRRKGMRGVVWEGESKVVDTPALWAFLDLVSLADHPGDRFSYAHFLTTPLAAAKFKGHAAVPNAAELSEEMARAFTSRGLVRVFRELRALLPARPEEAWSEATEERFAAMLRSASEFEGARESATRISDFIRFLSMRVRRCVAEPGRIKVMTIHRSKGLGFDYVVLPLMEDGAIDAKRGSKSVLETENWVLPGLGPQATERIPGIRAVAARRDERAWQEALCTYYVAMTRAKRAMTIILAPPLKSGEGRRFSDFVREALPEEIGDRAWHLAFAPAAHGVAAAESEEAEEASDIRRAPRERLRRRLPSQSFRSGMSAGELFAPRPSRAAAMKRGTEIHAMLARTEWPENPAIHGEGLREAFTRPDGFQNLWREKPYEIFADGVWESGVIDRVVFAGGEARIYDFKTNRPFRGESAEEFAARMDSAYSGQLESYRRAVHALTGLPLDRIHAKLLFA